MTLGTSYSTVCANELLSRLVPQYRVEEPEACRFWQRGINDTYQLTCSSEIYSLRVYRHGLRSRDEIDFEIAALNYLKEQGASVAYPIARREGGFVSEIQAPEGARFVVMTTHAKGSEPGYCGAEPVYQEDARLFGASVAELHNLSEGFETKHKRPGLDTDYLLDASLDVIRPFLKHNGPELQFIDDMAANLRRTVSGVPVNNLDVGFCHGDCHGSNVHNDKGSLTHFDFDCCGFGFRVFELATFKWGILDDEHGSELWSSFLDGYRSRREIGAEDSGLIEPFVIIRQIFWMALIMGNAADFGYGDASDEFVNQQLSKIRELGLRLN